MNDEMRCIHCGEEAAWHGLFFPDDEPDRVYHYAICEECRKKPGIEEKSEAIIYAWVHAPQN